MKKRSLRNRVFRYVKEKYGAEAEYPWFRYPDYAVFRHEDSRKWYGLVMNLPKSRLGLSSDEEADILNLKVDDLLLRDLLIRQDGFFPGYHISRGNWISVLLDGTVRFEEIAALIDRSYRATASQKKKQDLRPPKEWIIPANPKYYDIVHAFDSAEEILWKQGKGIKAGDTVFLYVAEPVSAVLFRCAVTETGIPWRREDGELTIRALMKIRLEKRYPPEQFTFRRLNDEFAIYAVRGPRGIPKSLSEALKQ